MTQIDDDDDDEWEDIVFENKNYENYYKILKVSRDSSADDIRASYLKLVLETHPDKNPYLPNAAEKFQLIQIFVYLSRISPCLYSPLLSTIILTMYSTRNKVISYYIIY